MQAAGGQAADCVMGDLGAWAGGRFRDRTPGSQEQPTGTGSLSHFPFLPFSQAPSGLALAAPSDRSGNHRCSLMCRAILAPGISLIGTMDQFIIMKLHSPSLAMTRMNTLPPRPISRRRCFRYICKSPRANTLHQVLNVDAFDLPSRCFFQWHDVQMFPTTSSP